MSTRGPPTLGFVCPLWAELKAVKAIFDEELAPDVVDEIEYHYGRIGSHFAVAVTFLHGENGPHTAARYATNLVKDHRSLKQTGSFCFLVGVAGGLWQPTSDIRLGDVVIATRIWDWTSGKQTDRGFLPTSYPEKASSLLLSRLGEFLYDRYDIEQSIVEEISHMQNRLTQTDQRWKFPGEDMDILYLPEYSHLGGRGCSNCDITQTQQRARRRDPLPRIHDGILASGNVVIKDSDSRLKLQEQHALAVEMEACGVPSDFIVIRGISNYADSHKNDDWQPYAAATAAACARLMIEALTKNPPRYNKSSQPQHLHTAINSQRYASDPAIIEFSQDSTRMLDSSIEADDQKVDAARKAMTLNQRGTVTQSYNGGLKEQRSRKRSRIGWLKLAINTKM